MQRAGEGFWARLAKTLFGNSRKGGLTPSDIAWDLWRCFERQRVRGIQKDYGPNYFLIYVNPSDWEALSGFKHALTRELAAYVENMASEGRVSLVGPVTVELESDPAVRPGATRIHSHLEEVNPIEEELPWELVVISGPCSGLSFRLRDDHITVGRARLCEVFLDDDQISPLHCRMNRVSDSYVVIDLDTASGTWVNEERIQKRRLDPGDKLRLGNTVAEIRCV
ncbi:MAG: DUF3662 domain-containing protein [Clostridia bacterium]|nr:DUF3662 domain-containing protein [Clostridia bacterium]